MQVDINLTCLIRYTSYQEYYTGGRPGLIAEVRDASPPTIGLADLARPSLIVSLIQLRPETFGIHHAARPAKVTDLFDLRWTQPRILESVLEPAIAPDRYHRPRTCRYYSPGL